VAVIGYVTLIPRYLAWGAAFTVVASLGTRFWLTLFFSQRLLRIEYQWGPVLRLLGIAATLVGLSTLIPNLPWAASVGLHTLLYGVYATLVLWLILSPADRSAIRTAVRRLRARTAPAHATT
jgi:hypothetical protein